MNPDQLHGDDLRELRKRRGLTQQQLATRADVHRVYVAKLEAGERLPSLDVATRLARALGLSLVLLPVEEGSGK